MQRNPRNPHNPCGPCNGQGYTWAIGDITCPTCHGTGKASGMVIDLKHGDHLCPTCHGAQILRGQQHKVTCQACGGSGYQ